MAKRRTRKEKMIARLRRELIQHSAPSETREPETPKPMATLETSSVLAPDKLFLYKPELVTKDLTKTGLYSLLLTAVILGLYWYFERGGKQVVDSLILNGS
jgi:hypothetical protein